MQTKTMDAVKDPKELVGIQFAVLVAGQGWAQREGRRLALLDLKKRA